MTANFDLIRLGEGLEPIRIPASGGGQNRSILTGERIRPQGLSDGPKR